MARKRAIALPAAVGVAAYVAVGVADVIPVFFVEGGFVRLGGEAAAPEEQALVQAQPDAFEEKGVLQPAEVAQVRVGAQGAVQVGHAEREVLWGEAVD